MMEKWGHGVTESPLLLILLGSNNSVAPMMPGQGEHTA